MNLLAELKRRNVIRVAGLYLVGAWLIAQVAETVLPPFDVPSWVLRAIIVLLALGFVPALVVSWIFELTPKGLRRDAEARLDQPVEAQAGRVMDRLLVVGLLAVVAIVAADRYWPRDAPVASTSEQPALAAPKVASASDSAGRLVAVLPFRNRSTRAEDAFFAEGIHDDLLTQLSKVAALKVISRTSMMRYADSTKTIPEIAAELGAAVVLEGAVQRAGDNVRVNVQLIDGRTDVHLWAENYNRALTTDTIFAIQTDIAEAVAGAMQVVLSPQEASTLRTGSTRNLQAYEAFLRGKLLSGATAISAERSQQAIAEFDRAIALDPDFAEAYARKARIELVSYWLAVGPRALREQARESVARAHRLAPDNIETLLAQALEYYYGDLDYTRADSALKKVLALAPNHAEAWETIAYVARRDGRFDDAMAAFERSLSINPQEVDAIQSLVEMHLIVTGDFGKAATLLQRAKELGGDTRVRRIWLHEWQADLEQAWATIDGPVTSFIGTPVDVAMELRDPERIAYALSPEMWPEDQRGPGDFPEAYAMAEAEAMLVLGKKSEADRLLAGIKARMDKRSNPYPSRWLANAYYQPCDLPGMLGDLEGVRAAEADFLKNAPRDVWGSRGIMLALAIAFARAGDPERSIDYLEKLAGLFGPHLYPWMSVKPGLDAARKQPRFLALETRYKAWQAANRHE
jgi:TolB-like protein/Tfp pilus assembly protein PilF